MAPRNLRKKRPADSDDEDEDAGQQTLQERIGGRSRAHQEPRQGQGSRRAPPSRTLASPDDREPATHRASLLDPTNPARVSILPQGVGADALALGDGKADAEPDEPEDAAPKVGLRPGAGAAGAMSGAFSAGAAVHTDGEDPNMLRYVEEELAKRRAGDATVRDDAEAGDAPAPATKISLGRPGQPRGDATRRRRERRSTHDRHRRGATPDGLQDAKHRRDGTREASHLERAREGDEGDAAARGAHDGRATGGVVDDRLRLDRKMFASSFGKGGGPRGDASSRARWRERDDERRETTNGGARGGGGGRGAAAEVASDDLVFKRWMNNEKKRVRR